MQVEEIVFLKAVREGFNRDSFIFLYHAATDEIIFPRHSHIKALIPKANMMVFGDEALGRSLGLHGKCPSSSYTPEPPEL